MSYSEKKLIVHYLKIFSNRQTIELPSDSLSFDLVKKPTRKQIKKYTLVLYNNKQQVLTIETNQDNFSSETLEKLGEELKQI